ncbi:MAG: DNA repair protein RecN [Steroidobacteraceae bacterium]
MLTHLHLRDFVIVDEAELELGRGLTALTGETGAGKSIIVDALLLIAGGRGGADSVRQGAERAEVAASFSELPAAALMWLAGQAVDHDGEIIVRRVIGSDGRSRAYLNGQMMPIQQLREFADLLIEIHGQQEFQHLVKRGAQREMLDAQIADPTLARTVADAAASLRNCRQEYDALQVAAASRDSRLELLRHQLGELSSADSVASIEELFLEQKRLAAGGRLSGAARGALDAVYDADAGSAHDLLGKAATALRSAADTDPALAPPAQLLAEATILAHEAAEGLRHYLDALDLDPGRQEEIERRAAGLESLARKHRIAVRELPAQRERLASELESLDRAEHNLEQLARQLVALEAAYRSAAERLSAARQLAADRFGRRITELMQTLGMSGGRFAVALSRTETEFGTHGWDDIEFMVTANAGTPLKGLAKVASGGELSRISLAVQVAGMADFAPGCMVFDEVDAGIGGATAEIVGRQLRDLGARSQVLCVTHLAQVAAQAHTQFQVIKRDDGKITRTAVKPLGEEGRIDEIARMLGGVDITTQARAHARAMLATIAPSSGAPSAGASSADSPSGRPRSAPAARKKTAKGRVT